MPEGRFQGGGVRSPRVGSVSSADERQGVVRLLSYAASDLERRGLAYHGVVRRAARMLATLEAGADGEGCRGCGAELVQPPTGRRRKWCSESCRRRKRP